MISILESHPYLDKESLDASLAKAFEMIVGRGYAYMDYDWSERQNPKRPTTLDILLNSFRDQEKNYLLRKIKSSFTEKDTFRVMDQGSGYANSLRDLSRRFASENPGVQVEGYGISGDLESMRLGRTSYFDERTLAEFNSLERARAIQLMREHGIYSFNPPWSGAENLRFFGMQKDIHLAMKDFPFPLDLVFSNNAYFHLLAPWLALKRTADKLSVGGVCLIRTILGGTVFNSQLELIDPLNLVGLLRENNPHYSVLYSDPNRDHSLTIGIVKKEEVPFKTDLHLLDNDRGPLLPPLRIFKTVYSPLVMAGLLPIDSL